MGNEYLDKVEDNASVCTWSEKTQLEKGDSITEGYTSELWDFTRINSTQNEFQELRDIWVNGMTRLNLVLTLVEYTILLRCQKIQGNKAYDRLANLPTFVKKLMMIIGMSEQWAAAQIQQKGDGKCIPWVSLRDLILAHPDVKRRVDVLALSIYGLVIFLKAMGHINEAVADLLDRLGKQNTPVPAILAETFRSLNACRRVGKDYSPLKEVAATLRRDDITEERWIEILQNLREEDVMWKAHWMTPSEILYRCGSFDWRVVGYTPLLVLRQYKAEQFIPITQGPVQNDFSYKGDYYKKKMREISKAWKKEFERKNLELGRKIERLEDEKMYLSLDVDVQKIEVEKVRKEKRKIEKDRDDLKTQYKKTQLSLKRAELGKSSE
ncbi:hypothetical protein CXB51_025229 [Gossypium anomalum]|uniref:DUF7745 domain-containing protein n=1 Tax=Gossypium anomalum TaxID=47600 RepID=A0A8J6CUQ0_9ROSI|nr:hypothetical protein CXB51_025229 [Gossypium anomalum]